MKPLVLWCRWHDARLRLHGRSPGAVWGELVLPEETADFHFDLESKLLEIGQGERARRVYLDEMGVELDS